MYDHTLYCDLRYMPAFRTVEKLKCLIKDFLKVNGKETIKIPNKGEYIKFRNF